MRAAWDAAKARSPYFGAQRPQLPAPLGGAPHLTGEMPGDYGFDPLGLWERADSSWQRWIAEAELLHARWAMLAVVGCLVPELLSTAGADLGEPVWWRVRSACA
jgi:light-harvesting complex II chlorophyll a/b binding protein 7